MAILQEKQKPISEEVKITLHNLTNKLGMFIQLQEMKHMFSAEVHQTYMARTLPVGMGLLHEIALQKESAPKRFAETWELVPQRIKQHLPAMMAYAKEHQLIPNEQSAVIAKTFLESS